MKVTRASVDRSTDYLPEELDAISISLAGWDGEVGQGTVPVPDPAGNQEPYEGEQLLLEQDSLTVIDGFLGAVSTERGGGATGARRVHTMTLGDDNALLAGHATASWIRPAEAPATRWAAFVSGFLPGSITTTYLLTTNESGITLPAKTYRTDSLFDDLSADTIGPTGKTVYIEHRRFHWHLPTEGQTCSLSINDTTWNNSTSFFPTNPQRQKDGVDLRNKIYARNDAGVVVSVTDATSVSLHDSAGVKHQGYSEYSTETAAEMTRDINVTLSERKDERTTWTYTLGPMTAAQAIELIPGSQIAVTSGVHGLSASVKRIARVTLTYRHGARTKRFMATVELGFPRRVKRKPTKQTSSATDSSGGSGVATGGCDGCLPFDASQALHWWFGTFTFVVDGAGGSDGSGSTVYTQCNMNTATLGPMGTSYNYAAGAILGPDIASLEVDAQLTTGLGGNISLGINNQYGPQTVGSTGSFTIGSSPAAGVFRIYSSGGSTPHQPRTVNITFWIDPVGWVLPVPTSGQQVVNDHSTGDGSTTSFTTAFAYKPGSLTVKVNGVDDTADVTQTSGTAVVFAHPPLLNADIVYEYRAA